RPNLDDKPQDGRVPLTVKTSPTPLRTFEIGGGAQLDVVRAAVHGQVAWRHRNFLGGLRKFQVSVRPGLAFYPMRLQNLVAPTDYLPFVSAQTELRQPGSQIGRASCREGVQFD